MNAVSDVWVDSGTENLNTHVDELLASDLIRRTAAQIDVQASNSMVSAFSHIQTSAHVHDTLDEFRTSGEWH